MACASVQPPIHARVEGVRRGRCDPWSLALLIATTTDALPRAPFVDDQQDQAQHMANDAQHLDQVEFFH